MSGGPVFRTAGNRQKILGVYKGDWHDVDGKANIATGLPYNFRNALCGIVGAFPSRLVPYQCGEPNLSPPS
jgi:hypothetical protein